jgi:hypothetical protein
MLERLLTEQINPESRGLDEVSMVRLLEIMNAADAQVALPTLIHGCVLSYIPGNESWVDPHQLGRLCASLRVTA